MEKGKEGRVRVRHTQKSRKIEDKGRGGHGGWWWGRGAQAQARGSPWVHFTSAGCPGEHTAL